MPTRLRPATNTRAVPKRTGNGRDAMDMTPCDRNRDEPPRAITRSRLPSHRRYRGCSSRGARSGDFAPARLRGANARPDARTPDPRRDRPRRNSCSLRSCRTASLQTATLHARRRNVQTTFAYQSPRAAPAQPSAPILASFHATCTRISHFGRACPRPGTGTPRAASTAAPRNRPGRRRPKAALTPRRGGMRPAPRTAPGRW